jgi:superfamily II DNA helicase RecQ
MIQLLTSPHSFILLISPPASGKTSFLLKLLDCYPEYQWIFVSPLRALADEFEQRLGHRQMLVLTAEQLQSPKYGHLLEDEKSLFVIDEFHLTYQWGESFRYSLIDIWYRLAVSKAHVLALTATVDDELYEYIKEDSLRNFSHSFIVDCGNMKFKNSPQNIYLIYQKSWKQHLVSQLLSNRNKDKRVMVFVQYRHEVDQILELVGAYNIRAIGCKGGEVKTFREQLKCSAHHIELIISTSCLSHGVNLPSFSSVFITHNVSESFWLQMAARAGRQGEKFDIYTVSGNNSMKAKASFLLRNLKTRIHLCFWKEFSFINSPIRKET